MRVDSPCDLVLVALVPGVGRDYERRIHREFSASRVRGEWVAETPELVEFCRVNHHKDVRGGKRKFPRLASPSEFPHTQGGVESCE